MSDFFTMQAGEVAAPVPDGPVLCAVSAAMRRIHRVFLWAYGEAPGLARSVSAGDTERSEYVGEALGTFDRLLHMHHESEDLLMYPRLEARAPACALHVAQMLAHHASVAAQLEVIAPVREGWASTADPALGEDLAVLYEKLDETLKVHLRREVTEVTPAVEKVLTQAEWDELVAHGRDSLETKVVFAFIGMVLATNGPDDRAEFLNDVPMPMQQAYREVGKDVYDRQYATLFPGREIPETM